MALAAVAAALAAPAAAQATTSVAVADGVLRIVGERGKHQSVSIFRTATRKVDIYMFESSAQEPQERTRPRRGRGCAPSEFGTVCSGFRSVSVALGDRNDELWTDARLTAPLRYSGGTGWDSAAYGHPGRGTARGVFIDNDGVADDGAHRRDDIERDVEQLGGSGFSDTLGSHARGARMNGGPGDDVIRGGPGPDRIVAAQVAADEDQPYSVYDDGRDRITCGGGQDFVLHDVRDSVTDDCDATGAPSTTGPYFLFSGSSRDDFLGAPDHWDPARMYGRGGDDVIQPPPAGRNLIDLGSGRDRTREVGFAENTVRGGPGPDSIDMREGIDVQPNFGSDTIDCGSGRDRVLADPNDTVADDCESVTRAGRPAR